MGSMLMPTIMAWSAENQGAEAPPEPQTMAAYWWPHWVGKFSPVTSNQYSWIAAAWVVWIQMPASRTAVLPVAWPHWIRALAKFCPSEEDSWLLPEPNAPCPDAQSWPA